MAKKNSAIKLDNKTMAILLIIALLLMYLPFGGTGWISSVLILIAIIGLLR